MKLTICSNFSRYGNVTPLMSTRQATHETGHELSKTKIRHIITPCILLCAAAIIMASVPKMTNILTCLQQKIMLFLFTFFILNVSPLLDTGSSQNGSVTVTCIPILHYIVTTPYQTATSNMASVEVTLQPQHSWN